MELVYICITCTLAKYLNTAKLTAASHNKLHRNENCVSTLYYTKIKQSNLRFHKSAVTTNYTGMRIVSVHYIHQDKQSNLRFHKTVVTTSYIGMRIVSVQYTSLLHQNKQTNSRFRKTPVTTNYKGIRIESVHYITMPRQL